MSIRGGYRNQYRPGHIPWNKGKGEPKSKATRAKVAYKCKTPSRPLTTEERSQNAKKAWASKIDREVKQFMSDYRYLDSLNVVKSEESLQEQPAVVGHKGLNDGGWVVINPIKN